MTSIGTRVREWREKQVPKISQVSLAEAIGVKQPTLSDFETSGKYLGEATALRLEIATGGEIKAVDCVHPDRRDGVAEIARSMSRVT